MQDVQVTKSLMLANILLLHLPLTPGVGSNGQFFISESSHVALLITLRGMKYTTHSALLHTVDPWMGLKGQKKNSEEFYVAFQI